MKSALAVRIALLLLLAVPTALLAQAETLSYQGRLTANTPGQEPVDATLPMEFSIWNSAAGGTLLWKEPASGGVPVVVTDGLFGVQLGSVVPIPVSLFSDFGDSLHLQVTIEPGPAQETLLPRQRISPTAFARFATVAQSSATAASADFATNAASASVATFATTAAAAASAEDCARLGGVPSASFARIDRPIAFPPGLGPSPQLVGPADETFWIRSGAGQVLGISGSNGIGLGRNGTSWYVDSTSLEPWADAAADLGTPASRVRNVYLGRDLVHRTEQGAEWIRSSASELISLDTSDGVTDSSGDLLPAGAILEAVVARVTSAIDGASEWKLGDAAVPDRFLAPTASVAEGSTAVGLAHVDRSGTAGPVQNGPGKVRITTNGVPTGGAVRVTVFYRKFHPPAT